MCEECKDCDDCAAVDALTFVVSDLFKLLLDKNDRLTLELHKMRERYHTIKMNIDMKHMEEALEKQFKKGGDDN